MFVDAVLGLRQNRKRPKMRLEKDLVTKLNGYFRTRSAKRLEVEDLSNISGHVKCCSTNISKTGHFNVPIQN